MQDPDPRVRVQAYATVFPLLFDENISPDDLSAILRVSCASIFTDTHKHEKLKRIMIVRLSKEYPGFAEDICFTILRQFRENFQVDEF